ncbi:hypothetical protein SLS60_011021 [Paraconiothyrium brasiliense]|uniref:Uncharacterized protein n=1 Tax=Paraconiothyrium brasiliense TaxID=300254 RepID=A0ABR3QKD6_9PLEO
MASNVTKADLLLLPMKLDAFVFNEHVCNGGKLEAKIAPITQPNYTFLRLENFYLQNDIVNPLDLHAVSPASKNSRFTDLRTAQPRTNRQGVYLHWMVPRMYRLAGVQKKESDISNDSKVLQPAPNRWLVVRLLDLKSIEPANAKVDEVEAWIIESDRKRDIYNDLTENDDFQVDVSPFVAAEEGEVDIRKQAEVFIGKKTALSAWDEAPDPQGVTINLLNSSNQLFADYQPHNSNVFSMVDPFEYSDGTPTRKKLSKANASYYVIGWHGRSEQDPFFKREGETLSRDERLTALSLMLADRTSSGVAQWLSETAATTRALCHGAMYDVEWDTSKKPRRVPADDCAKRLNEQLPVAVGEAPLESLLAFVEGQKTKDAKSVQDLAASIDSIRLLLRSKDDGVEAQRKAEDSLAATHYMQVEGGVQYNITGSAQGGSGQPSPEDQAKLVQLNKMQALLDSSQRIQRQLQWDMFALWWKYLSDPNGKAKADEIKADVNAIRDKATPLRKQMLDLTEEIEELKSELPAAKPGACPPFARVMDPNLLVGGVRSSWPHDFLLSLKVRLSAQTARPANGGTESPAWTRLFSTIRTKCPAIGESAVALLQEFLCLAPTADPAEVPPSAVVPLYHDLDPAQSDSSGSRWRDRWAGTQPWFPLFMEWEAEYVHIPFGKWELQQQTSSRSTVEKLAYQIRSDVDLTTARIEDKRVVSGRSLILPQPSVSLRLIVSQLFSDTPPAVLESLKLTEEERRKILESIDQLGLLSAPLAGFIDHLTTKFQGSHVKPFAKLPNRKITIGDAVTVSRAAGFTDALIGYIGEETDLTPYGTSVTAPHGASMFKPATHGQFRLTKVNIIDKFGQVVHAIDPTVPPQDAEPLYPCISESLRPQPLPGQPLVANAVRPDKPGKCEFVQLPPRINQPARINAHFVRPYTDKKLSRKPLYKRVPETESPVWGWIVVNFPNNGLQVFLPDGTFYREIRFGGPKGTLASEDWLPFGPPSKSALPSSDDMAQLQALIERLKQPDYLDGFVKMIVQASKNQPAAPSGYSEMLSSVVGKPLALVRIGWSLELATDQLVNQSSFRTGIAADKTLLEPTEPPATPYSFPIKIGDRKRLFDGMVGYFNVAPKGTPSDLFDLEQIQTYFIGKMNAQDARVGINMKKAPLLKPTWVPPYAPSLVPDSEPPPIDPVKYAQDYNANLLVVGALIDPFTPVNVYSGILPPKSLQLLPWVWQDALQKMTAFLHLGPLVMINDVPPYDQMKKLTDRWDEVTPVKSAVRMHTMQGVDWAWLQPYIVKETVSATGEGSIATEGGEVVQQERDTTVFMPLAVDQVEPELRFETGPYTAIEGYLQMRRGVVQKAK